MDGVTGDGVRTVSLFFKATVKLIQVVGQAKSLMEWGALGLQLVICLSPFQMEPESPENWYCSLSEYSRLASLTSLLNLYIASLSLSLSPLHLLLFQH